MGRMKAAMLDRPVLDEFGDALPCTCHMYGRVRNNQVLWNRYRPVIAAHLIAMNYNKDDMRPPSPHSGGGQ